MNHLRKIRILSVKKTPKKTTEMTDAQKVEALTELLSTVMNTLELKQYLIEDPTESYECEFQANQFHQQMIEILYGDQ
jgi:hypothetical protein